MHHSAALIDDLTTLSDALDDPDINLPAVCSVLAESLTAAIPAFLGLNVMVHVDGDPLLINSIDRRRVQVRASLQMSLLPLGAATTTGSIAFYGGTPGAFLALADDVRWIFNLDGHPILDGHLPPKLAAPPVRPPHAQHSSGEIHGATTRHRHRAQTRSQASVTRDCVRHHEWGSLYYRFIARLPRRG